MLSGAGRMHAVTSQDLIEWIVVRDYAIKINPFAIVGFLHSFKYLFQFI